jgi:hypothetical protein
MPPHEPWVEFDLEPRSDDVSEHEPDDSDTELRDDGRAR